MQFIPVLVYVIFLIWVVKAFDSDTTSNQIVENNGPWQSLILKKTQAACSETLPKEESLALGSGGY